MTTPSTNSQLDEGFRQQVSDISEAWHDNAMPFVDAHAALQALLQQSQEDDNLLQVGHIENSLGIMQGYRGKYDESIAHFQRALEAFQTIDAQDRASSCVLNIGETYRLRGNFTQARKYFHRAYKTSQKMGNLRKQATALTNEGQMWLSLKSLKKARSTLEKALDLSEQALDEDDLTDTLRTSVLDNTCEIHHALATVCLQEDDKVQAWKHAKQAYQLSQEIGRELRVGYANRILGDVITAMQIVTDDGFESDPDFYYKAAMKAFRNIKSEGEVGKTLLAHGTSLARRGRRRSGGQKLQQAMVIFTRLGMTNDAARAAEAQMDII